MKKLRHLALVLLAGLSTNVKAQSTNDPLYRHIPIDAEKVYSINVGSIISKIDLKTALASMPPNAFEKNKEMFAILSNPDQLGIDLHQQIFVAETNVLLPDSPHYTTLIIPLTDSGKFIQFLQKQFKNGEVVFLPGKTRTARHINGHSAYAWNSTLAVMTIVKPTLRPNEAAGGAPKHPATTPAPEMTPLQTGLSALRKCVAALKGFENSHFVSDPFFRKGFDDLADFHSWSRLTAGMGMATTMMQMSHAPMDPSLLATVQKLKHSHVQTLGTLRFDNGLISFRSRIRYDSLHLNLDHATRPLDQTLIARLPQGNLLGLITVHLDLNTYFKMMETMENGKGIHTLDSILAKKGLTTKEVLTAFKGDLLVAAIDNGKMIPATDTTPAKPAAPGFFIVLTINDKAAFDKVDGVLHLTRDATAPATTDSTKSSPFGKWHPYRTVRDNIFVLGPTQAATDAYFDKPSRGPSRLVTDEVLNNPIAVAIDMKALEAYLQPTLSASEKTKPFLKVLDQFDMISYAGGQMEGQETELAFQIRMTNLQENSLTTLLKVFQSMK